MTTGFRATRRLGATRNYVKQVSRNREKGSVCGRDRLTGSEGLLSILRVFFGFGTSFWSSSSRGRFFGEFAMTLGCSGSAFLLFNAEVFEFPFFLRALTGARRGEFGGEERSESTPLSNAGCCCCCFALDIMKSEGKCRFVCFCFSSRVVMRKNRAHCSCSNVPTGYKTCESRPA